MGLAERRKIKELQDTTLPGRVKEIEEICGAPIPYDVEWESFADDMEALNFMDNISCHRLNMALRVICQDDMGKQAVREGLGIASLPCCIAEADAKLERIPKGAALEMDGIWLVVHRDVQRTARVRVVIEAIEARLVAIAAELIGS